MTRQMISRKQLLLLFQYRKRYEVTCDMDVDTGDVMFVEFQYRKRYEVTCDRENKNEIVAIWSFNTASGMRSHVTFGDNMSENGRYASFNTASGMRSHVTF